MTSIVWAVVILFFFGEGQSPINKGDGIGYNQIALNLIHHQTVSFSENPPIEPTLIRTPGYPIFLAIIYSVSENSIVAVRFVQFILLGLTALMLYRLVLPEGELKARVAAVFCITYIPFVAFCSYLLTETLITAMSVLLILSLSRLKRKESDSLFGYTLVGALLGAMTMVRPSFSIIVFLIIIGISLEKGFYKSLKNFQQSFKISVLILIGFSVIVAPWLARNYNLSHKVVMTPITSQGLYWSIRQYKGTSNYDFADGQWENLYDPLAKENSLKVEQRFNSSQGELTKSGQISDSIAKELLDDEVWKGMAKLEFRDLSAWQVLKNIPYRIFYLWGTNLYAPKWMIYRVIQRIPEVQVLVMFLLAIGGVIMKRKELPQDWALWVLPVCITVLHLIFHVEYRYTFPARPFMLIYSAVGFIWLYTLLKKTFQKDTV